MLKKALLTKLRHTSFFTTKFKCSTESTKNSFFFCFFFLFARGFAISEIVFGCDKPTYDPSPVRELSFITQFSGLATLQSLALEKQWKGYRSSMVLSIRSDDLTYNPSPSNP